MTDTPTAVAIAATPSRAGVREWFSTIVSVLALIVTVSVLLFGSARSDGQALEQVANNTRRIENLELRATRRDDQLADLRERIGAMDAKLDLLVRRSGSTN